MRARPTRAGQGDWSSRALRVRSVTMGIFIAVLSIFIAVGVFGGSDGGGGGWMQMLVSGLADLTSLGDAFMTAPLPDHAALAAQYGGLNTVAVRRVEWNELKSNRTSLKSLFEKADAGPVIVVGGPATLWPASQWTPDRLRQTAAIFPSVRLSKTPAFRYWDDTKLMEVDETQAGLSSAVYGKEVVDVPASDLFFRMLQLADGIGHIYASADLDLPDMQSLRRDVRPIAPLNIFPGTPSTKQRQFVWVASKGATAPFHYDTSHNMYVQTFGRKRFFLLPPKEHDNLYIHPVAHPADRQSQVEWMPTDGWKNDPTRFPLFFNVETVHVADLAAGEMLVLPALWFHHVQATSLSISVNLWQLSKEATTLEGILADALPLWRKSWPADKTLVLLQHFLPAVIAAALDGTSASCREVDTPTGIQSCVDTYVNGLLERQYQPLGLYMPQRPSFSCSASTGRGLDAALEQPVRDITAKFRAMAVDLRRIYLGVWLMHLGDFGVIEAGATPSETGSFLGSCICATCLDSDNDKTG